MNLQIDNVMKRTRGYWFVDGFTEMLAGVLFIILAGIMLIRGYASQGSFPAWFLSTTGEIVVAKFLGGLAAILILWWLKDHFTYPRTGFVRGNRITATQIFILIRNIFLFILLPLVGLLAISVLLASESSVLAFMPVWFPVSVSMIWAILIVLSGEWIGLSRFRLLGIAILIAGVAVALWQNVAGISELPANIQIAITQPNVLEIINRTLASLSILILVCGVLIMVSGVITFLRYRKENPIPYTEDV